MNDEFINLTAENIGNEHLCCIIRSKKAHPGIEAKRAWLSERLKEGHVFRKLNVKGTVFIEYAPLEKAWTPVIGDNYLYIYCLWVLGEYRGHGYARALLEYCIEDAKSHGKSGVCMLGAIKQKAWLSDQAFVKRFGFTAVDSTESGYELLALSFDGTKPSFTEKARKCEIEDTRFTVFYDMQCPFISQNVSALSEYCDSKNIPSSFIEVDTLQKAKSLPCVFNNYAIFYGGKLQTVNLSDASYLNKLVEKNT